MAIFKEHCRDCMKVLGNEYVMVHKWLDEFAKEYPIKKYGDYHRRFRHHRKGIEIIRKIWGDDAARAAEIHIKKDMGYIVKDEKDFLPTYKHI